MHRVDIEAYATVMRTRYRVGVPTAGLDFTRSMGASPLPDVAVLGPWGVRFPVDCRGQTSERVRESGCMLEAATSLLNAAEDAYDARNVEHFARALMLPLDEFRFDLARKSASYDALMAKHIYATDGFMLGRIADCAPVRLLRPVRPCVLAQPSLVEARSVDRSKRG